MKNLVSIVSYLALALPLLLLEAVFGFVLMMYRLLETWLRTARELREEPPPGGMYGTMARRLHKRARSKKRNSDMPYQKSTTTAGGKND